MTNPLTTLTEADIRARCSETSFERGRNYYDGGAIKKRWRHGETRLASVQGADGLGVEQGQEEG